MTILGIDPGTATTGFGIITQTKPGKFSIVKFGVITTDRQLSEAERLSILAHDLRLLIKTYNPTIAGVEKLFFTSNQKTAIAVAQARGVIMVELFSSNIVTHEFTPLQVKSIICGYGKAEKKQVQFMVKKIFGLRNSPKPDDAADALAIAVCAGQQLKKHERTRQIFS